MLSLARLTTGIFVIAFRTAQPPVEPALPRPTRALTPHPLLRTHPWGFLLCFLTSFVLKIVLQTPLDLFLPSSSYPVPLEKSFSSQPSLSTELHFIPLVRNIGEVKAHRYKTIPFFL